MSDELLKQRVLELSVLHGVSSREEDVIAYMRKEFQKITSDVTVDVLGNVILRIPSGRKNAKRLMVFAHTDELGFIVRRVEADGFVRITRVGGVSVNVLPGSRVDVLGKKGTVTGVIGLKSHHVTKPEEKGHIAAVDDLYVDLGFSSKEEVNRAGIYTGCFCTFAAQKPLILNGSRICAKAMDDRACCAAMIHYAEYVKLLADSGQLHWDIYVVACVQEEFNVRGIMPAVNRILPDAAIGLDIAVSTDTPDLAGAGEICLGGGPGVTYLNFHGRGTLAGVLPDKNLLEELEAVCEASQIPFQREVIIGLITENAFISFQNQGVPVANLSLPCRYTHTAIEMIDLCDLELLIQVLNEFTKRLRPDQSFGKNDGRKEETT